MRRNCGGGIPGAGNIVVDTQQDHEKEVKKNNMDCKLMIDPSRINDNNNNNNIDNVRQRYSRCRQSIDNTESGNVIDNNNNYYYDERLNFDNVDTTRTSEESNERISGTCNTSQSTRRTRRCQDDHGQSSETLTDNYHHQYHESPKSIEVSRFRRRSRLPSYLATLLLISYTLFGIAGSLTLLFPSFLSFILFFYFFILIHILICGFKFLFFAYFCGFWHAPLFFFFLHYCYFTNREIVKFQQVTDTS